MAAVTEKLLIEQPADGPEPISLDQQYWNEFRSPLNIPSAASYPITHISCPSVNPKRPTFSTDSFIVTSGARVDIFSSRTRKSVRQISRFKDDAHSAEIRQDGRVLVAGDDTGVIQVFDVNSRAILKTWDQQKQPVWTTKFSPTNLTAVLSTGDDRTVRLWDLPSQDPITTFTGHEDYVRSGAFIPDNVSGLLLSGSYDETVRIWDPRSPSRAAMTFKHAAPVEAVLPMPSGTTIIAAADNRVSILDIVAGKPLTVLKNHQKTVTSLCLASKGTRVVCGGLDGHVKIFDTSSWNVVAGLKYPSPILSLSVIPGSGSSTDKHLAVGMQSGVLSIRTKLSVQQQDKAKEREKEMQALVSGDIAEHDRKEAKKRKRSEQMKLSGRKFRPEIEAEGAVGVSIDGNAYTKPKKLAHWEQSLRKGRWAEALDKVLAPQPGYSVPTVHALLTALRHRTALMAALRGRDSVTLQPILKWVTKCIKDPKLVEICVEVALDIFYLYSDRMGMSTEIDELVRNLHQRVRREVSQSLQACQTEGMVEMLMASSVRS
ncbi:MAG: hypothetical protein M1814_001208 [Vezdaea aestivalis]|nr:MAG: hypothetical protein M1814_001208 [Vezdaea aestivalis]